MAAHLFAFVFVPYVLLSFTGEGVAVAAVVMSAVLLGAVGAALELKLRWLWLTAPMLWSLIMAYCPRGLYGIESGGGLDFFPASVDAAAFALAYCIGIVTAAAIVYLLGKLFGPKTK